MEDKKDAQTNSGEFDPRTLSHVVTAVPVPGSYKPASKQPSRILGWLSSREKALARWLGWPSPQRSKKRMEKLEKEVHALLNPSKQKKG